MSNGVKAAETVVVEDLGIAISKLTLKPEDVLVLQSENGVDYELLAKLKEHISKVRPDLAGDKLILFGIRSEMDSMMVISGGTITTTAQIYDPRQPPRVVNLVIGEDFTQEDVDRLRQDFNLTVVKLADEPQPKQPRTSSACKNPHCKGLQLDASGFCSMTCWQQYSRDLTEGNKHGKPSMEALVEALEAGNYNAAPGHLHQGTAQYCPECEPTKTETNKS